MTVMCSVAVVFLFTIVLANAKDLARSTISELHGRIVGTALKVRRFSSYKRRPQAPLLGRRLQGWMLSAQRPRSKHIVTTAAGSSTLTVLGSLHTRRGRHAGSHAAAAKCPGSWEDVLVHAEKRGIGDALKRNDTIESEYRRYRSWLAQQGMVNHEYVLQNEPWEENAGIAFSPNMFPYETEPNISHWVLWHHPEQVAGDSELEPSAELMLVCELLGTEIAASEGHPNMTADSAYPWGPRKDEIVLFQNLPEKRSIQQVAHAHCFLRPRCDTAGQRLAHELARRRARWQSRSPWLKHLRVQSAGSELSGKSLTTLHHIITSPAMVLSCLIAGSSVAFVFRACCRKQSTVPVAEQSLLAA
eukprot:gnl/TRDRNA2_/TRDRNA2_168983_c0_seq2.p1 gnl/TRDRNA2_/TRDRNA2_168983_c0~~gnl/TRDRNA2_/TRDRNA2_168983_c0_seq2.p1  ORF type:complete len:359 (+),score=31.99 gnl/TRDRNA2_/TRDRNA2_168983_c0_seq2:111-1187(+)